MGARGPAPTPTAVLAMRGSWRAKTRAGEPQPAKGAPTCPRHLTADQKAVWRAVCRVLADMGVLTRADGGQLERYAVFFLRWRRAVAFLEAKDAEHARQGNVVPPGCYPLWSNDASTYVSAATSGTALVGFAEYPAVREAIKLDAALKQIEQQFGLTPAARARLTDQSAAEAAQPSPFAEFLHGSRRLA